MTMIYQSSQSVMIEFSNKGKEKTNLQMHQFWNGTEYRFFFFRKLEHGYNYLRQVKRVCFNDIEGRSAAERQREEEKKLKMDNLWRERVKRVKNQMDENEPDINDCLTQLNNCIELLKPRPDNFLFGQVM